MQMFNQLGFATMSGWNREGLRCIGKQCWISPVKPDDGGPSRPGFIACKGTGDSYVLYACYKCWSIRGLAPAMFPKSLGHGPHLEPILILKYFGPQSTVMEISPGF